MKKITVLALTGLLFASLSFAAEPTPADQKWLTVVEQKITEGQTKVSTPSEERVVLLKQWAARHGYSVTVTKVESGFRLDVSKSLAGK